LKIIVSHDIDHITAWEHKNGIIPKHIVRSSIELVTLNLTFKEYMLRIQELYNNKWQNIEEIIVFNLEHQIPATFFLGMSNGLGLDYSIRNAKKWIDIIQSRGFEVGVHGIEYQDIEKMKQEYRLMESTLGHKDFGIRMHYLRNNENTIQNIVACGYTFDSTLHADSNPYKIENMYEFPLHIMDCDIMYPNNEKWMTLDFEEIKAITMHRIEALKKKDIQYLTFLFHDRYFHDSFAMWKQWYIWTIKYLKKMDLEFISYKEAIRELNERDS